MPRDYRVLYQDVGQSKPVPAPRVPTQGHDPVGHGAARCGAGWLHLVHGMKYYGRQRAPREHLGALHDDLDWEGVRFFKRSEMRVILIGTVF